MRATSKQGYVYIMASKKHGTLYIGVTSNLKSRVYRHKHQIGSKFTTEYDVNQLVYFLGPMDIRSAISKEKSMKHWNRSWKINAIEQNNPDWRDLYATL